MSGETERNLSAWTTDTLKEYVEALFRESDRRYAAMESASEKAVTSALAAAEKAVAAAFESSEKAIAKAEAAQTAYNARSNEFRASLDDQGKTMLPRAEAESRFGQLRDLIDAQAKQINDLQRGESRGAGGEDVRQKIRSMTMWLIGLMVMAGLSVLGLVATLVYFLTGKH